jgi:hypothetical protein
MQKGLLVSLFLSEQTLALNSKTSQISSLDLDPAIHDDKDVTLYTKVMSEGHKFVENDQSIVQKRQQA